MNTNISLITKAKMGDKRCEEVLVEQNMPLVHSCARRLKREGYDYDDIVQLGSIGLIKAIRRFDTEYGVMFSTYAVPLIMGEIRRYLRDDGIIKVSRSLKEIKQKVASAGEELSKKLNRDPGINEISAYIGINAEKIIEAMEACSECDSLERPLTGDADGYTLADTINGGLSINDELEKIALKSALDTLDIREKKIIILRYFKGKTQAEVSAMIGVSQVQISRIEKRVLGQLRKNLG